MPGGNTPCSLNTNLENSNGYVRSHLTCCIRNNSPLDSTTKNFIDKLNESAENIGQNEVHRASSNSGTPSAVAKHKKSVSSYREHIWSKYLVFFQSLGNMAFYPNEY